MVAYAHVRRSMVASTCARDGLAAVEHATNAVHVPNAPARIRGLAAKQMAYGHALAGDPNPCRRALEEMSRLFEITSDQDRGGVPHPGRPVERIAHRSPVATQHLDVVNSLSQFRATCDIYLGGGERAIPLLDSVRNGTLPDSRRSAVNGARLARAHAQAGDPDRSCALALEALSTGEALDSLATRIELRRTLAPLDRWPGHEDVAEVRHRVASPWAE
jgi:hypothetical protein